MNLKDRLFIMLKIFAAALLLLPLLNCPSVNGHSERGAVFQGLADTESPLAYAVYSAEFIDDPNKKLDIYFPAAEAYGTRRWYAQAAFVLEKASLIVRDNGLVGGNPRLLIRMAKLYSLIQRPAGARELFERGLDEIQKMDEDWLKGYYLRSIIDFCLQRQEDFPEIYRRAIESVYIIQNITVRATVLLDIITLYRELGNSYSVDNLLQQTFAAAASIADPSARVEIFSRIALAYVRNGDSADAQRMIERLLEEIENAEKEREAGQDLPGLLPAAVNLYRMGRFREAEQLYSLINGYESAAHLRLEFAEESFRDGDAAAGNTQFELALEAAEIIENPVERGEFYLDAGTICISEEMWECAENAAAEIDGIIREQKNGESRDRFRAQLASSYIHAGYFDEGTAYITDIESPEERILALLNAAEFSGVKDEMRLKLIDRARQEYQDAPAVSEEILVRIAEAYAAAGDLHDAFRTIAEIRRIYNIGKALVAAGVYAIAAEDLSDAETLEWFEKVKRTLPAE